MQGAIPTIGYKVVDLLADNFESLQRRREPARPAAPAELCAYFSVNAAPSGTQPGGAHMDFKPQKPLSIAKGALWYNQ
ncbi:MAG: hypothetical protein R3A44_05095 [Caldilineaceae bacterium]